MPFLRFSRDKRGYESTYLCHTFRSAAGPQRLRVLYWFRTPPDVKVGRLALDPAAILAIEENNPDLKFDWDKILKVKPPPPPAPGRVDREERRSRRGRATGGDQAGATPRPAPVQSASPDQSSGTDMAIAAEGLPEELQRAADAAWDDIGAAAGENGEPRRHVVLGLTDEEGLARLRARHAEIQTRITDRFRDPARLDELRQQAALLDPDAWRTVDEARERLAALDDTAAALRKVLGRRRRTRRSGARRGHAGTAAAGSRRAGDGESASEATATADPEPRDQIQADSTGE